MEFNDYDRQWLLENVIRSQQRYKQSTSKQIFQGSYDVFSDSPDDQETYIKIKTARLEDAIQRGLIYLQLNSKYPKEPSYLLTDSGEDFLVEFVNKYKV